MRVGAGPGVRPQGWLRWFACPSGGAVLRGHVPYPASSPDIQFLLSEDAVGFFWSFCILSIICPCWAHVLSRFSHVQLFAFLPIQSENPE